MDSPHPPKPHRERLETDASLRAERAKTDAELVRAGAAVKRDTEGVLQAQRDRVEASVRATRERTDRAEHLTPSEATLRDAERAVVDDLVAHDHAAADERLELERAERERALFALLRFERETTDGRLVTERAQADVAIRSRDDFLGVVSHDLRTHLGAIALNAALVAENAAGQDADPLGYVRLAERIQRSTARMKRLIGDLLDVVSLEAGRLDIVAQSQDVGELLRDTADAFSPLFSPQGIAFRVDIAPDTPRAEFDHHRILQVLGNLLSNAQKFTAQGGEVAVRVAPMGTEVCFTVTDTGVGIPPDRAEDIFERFHQVDVKDRRGLGLGLYIAKCIVTAHRGRIWLERREEGGSAFHFTLPAVSSPA